MECSPPGSSVHEDSPGKNTRVGCHALLQGNFPAQGLNPGLLSCRWILYWVTREVSPGCRQCKCRTRLGSSLGISGGILLWTVIAADSLHLCFPLGSPGGSVVKKTWAWSLVGKIPWRRKLQSASVFLPGKSHAQNGLAGYLPWGRWELDMTEHTLMHVLPFRQHRNISSDHPLLPPTDLVRTITKKQLQSTLWTWAAMEMQLNKNNNSANDGFCSWEPV